MRRLNRVTVLVAVAAACAGCGTAAPAVELTSPTAGAIVAVSDGQLAASTTVDGFAMGSAKECEDSNEPSCGRVQLVIDGKTCGVVETAQQAQTIVIVSDCPLSAGEHTVKCELYDHKSRKVVATSEEIEIEIRVKAKSKSNSRDDGDRRCDGKRHDDDECDCCDRKRDDDNECDD